MNISYYTAVTALDTYQSDLDVTANNIANLNTNGYKPVRSNFEDLLYSRMDTNTPHLVGHGVKVNSLTTLFEQGIFERTGRSTDFAIAGDAFFAIEAGEDSEEPYYTRNGSFHISATEDGNFLTAEDGSYVLDQDLERIELEYKEDTGELDLDGLTGMIGLFYCDNPSGLVQVGSSRFQSGETSGEWLTGEDLDEEREPANIISGALEMSRTDMSNEMVRLLESQRAFQFNSRVVTTADQIEEIINNLR